MREFFRENGPPIIAVGGVFLFFVLLVGSLVFHGIYETNARIENIDRACDALEHVIDVIFKK